MSPNDDIEICEDGSSPSPEMSPLSSSSSSSVASLYNIEHDPTYQDSIQPSLNFSRLAYNLPQFNETYEVIRSKSDPSKRVMQAVKPTCSPESLKGNVRSLFPITDWLFNYNWKNDLMADFVAGITIAIFQVPQSKFNRIRNTFILLANYYENLNVLIDY
jgi:hypothetical protein